VTTDSEKVMGYSFKSGGDKSGPKWYAIVIYLPSELDQVIGSLRERFDPDYDLISAHMTLVFPFDTTRTLAELSQIISPIVQQSGPLKIQLGSIGDFYPDTPIIYWCAKSNPELNRLYKRLYAELDLPLPHREFIPHVTVAKEISRHRVVLVKDEVASYLSDETVEVKAVDLVSPVAEGHWVSVRTFPISTEST